MLLLKKMMRKKRIIKLIKYNYDVKIMECFKFKRNYVRSCDTTFEKEIVSINTMNVITILKVLFFISFAAPILRYLHIRFFSNLYTFTTSKLMDYRTRAVERETEKKRRQQEELGIIE